MTRVGIYCGSFNPIHIGHLALANFLCETGEVDEIWFIVSPLNPFKDGSELLDDHTRFHLVEIAIKGYAPFKACDIEFHLSKPSYTIHTIDNLKKSYPEYSFSLIIGGDNWQSFDKWYQSDRIIAETPIIIYPREEYPIEPLSLPQTVKLVDAPILEISATFIRDSIQKGKDIRYFLHPDVYNEIKEERLYIK